MAGEGGVPIYRSGVYARRKVFLYTARTPSVGVPGPYPRCRTRPQHRMLSPPGCRTSSFTSPAKGGFGTSELFIKPVPASFIYFLPERVSITVKSSYTESFVELRYILL